MVKRKSSGIRHALSNNHWQKYLCADFYSYPNIKSWELMTWNNSYREVGYNPRFPTFIANVVNGLWRSWLFEAKSSDSPPLTLFSDWGKNCVLAENRVFRESMLKPKVLCFLENCTFREPCKQITVCIWPEAPKHCSFY